MRRIDRSWGWGQIVGPHGSGKSTLVCWLGRRLQECGTSVQTVSLGPTASDHVRALRALDEWEPGTQVFADGYDGLPWWRRRWLRHRCRRAGAGLIVTTHRTMGLPTLTETRVTTALAHRIVSQVLFGKSETAGDQPSTIRCEDFVFSRDEMNHLLHQHGGNMREMLFSLYDRYEQTVRPKRTKVARPAHFVC